MILWRFRAIAVLYMRSVRELISLGPQTLVVPLLVPMFILLAFSYIYADVFTQLGAQLNDTPGFGSEVNYVQYLVAAPMVMAALLATASAGIGVAVERQIGFYDRMQLSPLGPSMSQFARRVADGTRIAIIVTVLSLVAWVVGANIMNWVIALGITIPLASTLGMAYGGLTFSLCLRSGSAEAAQAVTPLFFPFLFMSTAFVPLELLPHWMQIVAKWNPLSAVCDTIRDAYVGKVYSGRLVRAMCGIGVLAAVTQFLVHRAERRIAKR